VSGFLQALPFEMAADGTPRIAARVLGQALGCSRSGRRLRNEVVRRRRELEQLAPVLTVETRYTSGKKYALRRCASEFHLRAAQAEYLMICRQRSRQAAALALLAAERP
jgi:hypothetical protein